MFSVSAEFKHIYMLFNNFVQLDLLILWAELYNFLKDCTFVKVKYVVYLFTEFVKWTGEAGIFLDQSSSRTEPCE